MAEKPSKNKITGISIPEDIINTIDFQRGDINRSKYILRLLEKSLPSKVPSFSKKVAVEGDQ